MIVVNNKVLTTIVLDEDNSFKVNSLDSSFLSVEILVANESNILNVINSAKGFYISFVNSKDNIYDDYIPSILNKISNAGVFDCCFINYDVDYQYKKDIKKLHNISKLQDCRPYYGEYIWSFVYKKSLIVELLKIKGASSFNKFVDENFLIREAIENEIYFHRHEGNVFESLMLKNRRKSSFHKNIIYVGTYCNGLFNGYISWLINLGKAFYEKYDITVLYDEIVDTTLLRFQKYFKCVKRDATVNYVCDRLVCTYSTFYFPSNIIYTDSDYMFIHGNMSDFKGAIRFTDDIYDHYVAVSKIAAEKAKGYFNTDKIEYVLNPYVYDKDEIKPHLMLVSAQRYSPEKRTDRIIKMAKMLDELKIPYTWNLFTDKDEGTCQNGLVFRNRVTNVLDYVSSADYTVILSNTESFSYILMESLTAGTKVITTPLEICDELGISDGVNGFIIPFDYFDDGNEDKLKDKLLEIYCSKNLKFNYEFSLDKFDKYNDIFI